MLSELPRARTADDYDRLLPCKIHPEDLAINPKQPKKPILVD
jgi:hypothetical protein